MKNIKKLALPILIILAAVLIRLFPHPANFTPIAAMVLFGGAYLSRKYSIVIVLLSLMLSDYLLLYIHPFAGQFINTSRIYSPLSLIHASTILVYGSFFVIALVGMWLSSHKSAKNIITASLFSSILFFIVTNFNFFYPVSLYPKTLNGMFESYLMALPFFKNTLTGDLFYTTVFFGSFEAVMTFSKQTLYGYLHPQRG